MGATLIRAERRLPYAAPDLALLVGDVESYPRFIPWITALHVRNRVPLGAGWQGEATAVIGWRAIKETFCTHVRCAPEEGAVDVDLVSGPFKSLQNRWRFTPAGESGAHVRCLISYEFRNPILQGLAAAYRDKAADRIMAAFEAEARARFPA